MAPYWLILQWTILWLRAHQTQKAGRDCQGFWCEHLGWKGAAVNGSCRALPPMVQACRGPTATEPTAACWPILDTTLWTATGCCSRGVSMWPKAGWTPWDWAVAAGAGAGTRRLDWISLNMGALPETVLVVSCFFPKGACRKISSVSLGLWDAEKEAPLDAMSFVGVLKGASWKTSEVTGLSGGLTGRKTRPVEAAGFVLSSELLSSVGDMCLLYAALLCRL